MMRGIRGWIGEAVAMALMVSCGGRTPAPAAQTECAAPEVRDVVEQLGERMKSVSLLAPDSIVVREIRQAYAPLVTPDLLEAWVADPQRAPGRSVSSPWPDRIQILSVARSEDGSCVVEGQVIYVTSTEQRGSGEAAAREPVTLTVEARDGWRVRSYASANGPSAAGAGDHTAAPTDTAAVAVIRRYYEAIAARDYPRAYALWSDRGAASGQTLEEFAVGYAATARVEVEIGRPGRVEGAAGSRFIQIPVVVRAETVDGEMQRFEGTYTLRRSVVEGATAEQRSWRIYDAELRRTH